MKRIFAILAVLLSSLPGMAQIGLVNFTATGSFTLNSGDVLTLRAQIVGCGNGAVPYYNNLPISNTPNQTYAAPFTANASQVVTGVLPGNDKIICGTQSYTTYAFTWMDNGFPIAPTVTYRLVDNSTINLSTQVPVNFVPPVIGNSAGAYCPAATPIFTGFNAQYVPQCAANSPSTTAALPITGGTLQGNLIIPSPWGISSYTINGVVQADQFAGSDMCAKINAALIYAIANSRPLVNGQNFSGTQTCATNMFALGLAGSTTAAVTLQLGVVHIQSTVQQLITNSGVGLWGMGGNMTQIEYTGGSTVAAVLYVNGTTGSGSYGSNGINSIDIRDLYIYGGAANATDALRLDFVNRSDFSRIKMWGAVNACLDVHGAVTNTYQSLHCSVNDAFYQGIQSGSHTVPAFGKIFGGNTIGGTIDSTDSSVIDAIDEGLSNTGWYLTSATNLTFMGGTSEDNLTGNGIFINTTGNGVNPGTSNKLNTFINSDLEGNGAGTAGVDVTDNGQQNTYINLTAASTCSSCASVYQTPISGGGSIIIGDAVLKTGTSGHFVVIGNNPDLGRNGGTTTLAIASITTANVTQVNSGDFEGTGTFKGPILTSNGSLPTCAAGTGVTSCSVTAGSTQSRGFITITNASATTSEVLGTLNFASSLAAAPFCTLQQSGGVAYYGLFSNSTTTAHFTIVNTQTVSGVTSITLEYACQL
jgi:hypothetical protein